MDQVDERTRRELALTRKLYIVWIAAALLVVIALCVVLAMMVRTLGPQPALVGQVSDFPNDSVQVKYVNADFVDPETNQTLQTLPLAVVRDASGNLTVFFARSTDPSTAVLIPRRCVLDWQPGSQQFVDPCGTGQWGRDGRYVSGTIARDLDRFVMHTDNGNLTIDMQLIQGAAH